MANIDIANIYHTVLPGLGAVRGREREREGSSRVSEKRARLGPTELGLRRESAPFALFGATEPDAEFRPDSSSVRPVRAIPPWTWA